MASATTTASRSPSCDKCVEVSRLDRLQVARAWFQTDKAADLESVKLTVRLVRRRIWSRVERAMLATPSGRVGPGGSAGRDAARRGGGRARNRARPSIWIETDGRAPCHAGSVRSRPSGGIRHRAVGSGRVPARVRSSRHPSTMSAIPLDDAHSIGCGGSRHGKSPIGRAEDPPCRRRRRSAQALHSRSPARGKIGAQARTLPPLMGGARLERATSCL